MLIKILFSLRLFSLPLLFLFIWKGKETSLHPLRSLPDPFVNLCGLVTNSLLPAWMPPINAGGGQWVCMCMGSGTRRTWVQILPPLPAHVMSYHSQPIQGLSAVYAWMYRVTSPPTYPSCFRKELLFCIQVLPELGLLSQLVHFEQPSWSLRRWGAPNTSSLYWILLAVHLKVKKWGKEKSNEKIWKKLLSTMTIIL